MHEKRLDRRRLSARLALTLVDGSDNQKQYGKLSALKVILFLYRQLVELSSAPELNINAPA